MAQWWRAAGGELGEALAWHRLGLRLAAVAAVHVPHRPVRQPGARWTTLQAIPGYRPPTREAVAAWIAAGADPAPARDDPDELDAGGRFAELHHTWGEPAGWVAAGRLAATGGWR